MSWLPTAVGQHRTLRTSPAIAAGITTRLWEVSDIVALLEAAEARRLDPAMNSLAAHGVSHPTIGSPHNQITIKHATAIKMLNGKRLVIWTPRLKKPDRWDLT
jgi:hypothetical protein